MIRVKSSLRTNAYTHPVSVSLEVGWHVGRKPVMALHLTQSWAWKNYYALFLTTDLRNIKLKKYKIILNS